MTRDMWFKRFREIMRKMPESVELVVRGGGNVDMYKAGSLRAHLDRDTGFGMEEGGIDSLRHARLYAYPEGD